MTAHLDGTEASMDSQTFSIDEQARDTYRNLRDSGLSDADIMAFAGELLSLVATDVRASAAAE